MGATDVLLWLEETSLATYIRHSHFLYPVIEIIHILGFVLLAGSAFLFDLRLLGLSRNIAVTDLARHLLPWSRGSLLLVIPSGFILFMTQASSLGVNRIFWLKLTLITVAFINAGIFHLRTFRSAAGWERHTIAPRGARIAGGLSILLWTAVITCGRFLAYLE